MTSKHTPGPWSLAEADSTIPIRDAEGHTVASIRYRERDFSDACLIAAAPDMYEALSRLLGYAEDAAAERDERPGAIDAARAALAKAEGRQ